jgi:hypothetical protein
VDNPAEEAVPVELEALDHVGLVASDMARSVRHVVEITAYEPA